MADPQVPKHWCVCPWQAAADPSTAPYGLIGAPVATLFGTVDEAKLKAKSLAAAAPGTVWVVYLANWYSYTDETPVNLLPVIGVAV